MRILIVLPGLHRVLRGAEVAFEELAKKLALMPGCEVTLMGSGHPKVDSPYNFLHVPCIAREKFEKWPAFPYLRGHYVYEELTFLPGLMRTYQPEKYDVTVTCSYPYTNWTLRAKSQKTRPKHIFVTQNGDWMCTKKNSEYKHFSCDGLVCTNPEYFDNNKDNFPTVLIPNGVDPEVFAPGEGDRSRFNLPSNVPLAVMVSALIPSKRVLEGIRCVGKVEGLHLAIAGDGELRDQVQALGHELLGDRFHLLKLPRENMPELYRCADTFLHMSLDEPSANVYIEALATGLPIVTHDRRVTRWTLEDQAYLVDTTDEAAVANALSAALKYQTSDDVQKRRDLVNRRYSWLALAKQYYAFFQAIGDQTPALPEQVTVG
ncbi:glycosyltransferase family 4 protein [Leptolyngbya sp. KIOST-1]|uniref:glycosyltransferase family 4 protein n=1 Tax=Leptolyngbya sp. KIOST-1 TaxID=1229172 RepID=UPI00055F375C|nr:glycosyltransferase family 4 protein [Leptolyngbya sp. KIOST-1]